MRCRAAARRRVPAPASAARRLRRGTPAASRPRIRAWPIVPAPMTAMEILCNSGAWGVGRGARDITTDAQELRACRATGQLSPTRLRADRLRTSRDLVQSVTAFQPQLAIRVLRR